MQRLHDYTTLVAPSPFQIAGIQALNQGAEFYDGLRSKYEGLRNQLITHVEQSGLSFLKPEGTYFLYADAASMGFANDRKTAEHLRANGLAVVAGFGFYRRRARTNFIRFCFAKYPQTIERAGEVLSSLKR